MQTNSSQEKLPLDYFGLVFILAVPFWLFGGGKLPLPINLPVGALVTFVPVIAVSILSFRRDGVNGIKALLSKAFDYKKIRNKMWYLPILFLMPFLLFLSYVIMRLTGRPLPDPIQIPFLLVPVFFPMFFIGDTGEELGWTGYATDPMQNRWGAVKASFVLGIVWAMWHLIPWVQTGNPPNWIMWQALGSVAIRMLFVWFYNSTGKSVFAVTLVHDTVNMGEFLFPNYGSHYDPFITGVLFWLTAVIVVFGSRLVTLAQYRNPRTSRL
jgi:membrane protease YdiL (CAAX protease family)